MYKRFLLLSIAFIGVITAASQNKKNELDTLINKALQNNMAIQALQLQIESSKANIGTAYDFDKTTVYYGYDQNNYAPNNKVLNVFGINQTFSFPTVYGARHNLYKSQWEQNKILYEIEKNKLILNISILYQQIIYIKNKENLYIRLDSLYNAFSKAGERKFELGESNYLEKITSEAKSKQVHANLSQLKNQKKSLYIQLAAFIQDEQDSITIYNNKMEILSLENTNQIYNNYLLYNEAISNTYKAQLKLQKQNWFPDLNIELFMGTSKGLGYFQNGIQLGIGIPLLFNSNIAKTKTAKLEMQSWQVLRKYKEKRMEEFIKQKTYELNMYKDMIDYYTKNGKNLSEEIIRTAEMSYKNGEIDFFQYIQSLENALIINIDYLESVFSYNKSYLEMYYFNYTE